MQAAHPLVIAGATQTGMYERNPWKRLQRTLVLQYALTFGSKSEAHAAADRINEVHDRIHGVDPVTGKRFDATDPELLLWVHACLVESALLFERLTVGRLDDRGRQRFHEEQMLAAELVRLPRSLIPPTVPELEAYVADTVRSGALVVTDAARNVAGLFLRAAAGSGVAAGASDGGSPRLRDAAAGVALRIPPRRAARGTDGEVGDVRPAARLPAVAPGAVPLHRPLPALASRAAAGRGAGRCGSRPLARDPPVMAHSRS